MDLLRSVRGRARLAALAAVLTLAAACTGADPNAPGGQGAGNPVAARGFTGSSTASFSMATAALEGLDHADQQEQLRDWAQLGLASLLQLDAAALGLWLYDKTVVRTDLVDDLAGNPVEPGRRLPQGDLLHLLGCQRVGS